ncbi:hypothetical protein QLX67_10700 [Balneolaceae bacterium ANBcel3]|nr:hypothetical protein [Balneolaceae bacterium ANBcel3]
MSFSDPPLPPLPDAFIQRINRQMGPESSSFLETLNDPSATSVRINPFKVHHPDSFLAAFGEKPAHYENVPWSENGYYLNQRPSFTHDPRHHAGCYYVQEASSMFLEYLIRQTGLQLHNGTILDACASPGGKTTLLSALFPDALIVANEVIRSRTPALLHNVQRWGMGNTVVTHSETHRFRQLSGFFDLVLADVPCSGEGLFRKSPASRTEWTREKAHHCAVRQQSILSDLWECIRPGGYLIYTTCTYNPEENEGNLSAFLEQTGGIPSGITLTGNERFHLKESSSEKDTHQRESVRIIQSHNHTGYAFYPHLTKGEGFFISVLQKPSDARLSYTSAKGFSNKKWIQPETSLRKKAQEWLHSTDPGWFQIKDRIFHLPKRHLSTLETLSSALSVLYAGTETARMAGKDLRPAAPLALDIHLNPEAFPVLSFSLEEALSFLKCETLRVPERGKGWYLACYEGYPLGWLKHIGTRMNNYHPKEWRILK